MEEQGLSAAQAPRSPRWLVHAIVALSAGLALPATAAAASCPRTVDVADFAGARTLRHLNAVEADFGTRSTASANQKHFVGWIGDRLDAIPGLKTKSLRYHVDRWEEKGAQLTVDGAALPLAGAIPYAAPTSVAGVTAPIAYVASGEKITAANAAGRIVAVEDPLRTVPYSVFSPGGLGIDGYDPGPTLDPSAPYARDSRNEANYIQAAQDAGAVGILIVKDLPRDQIDGYYRPYSGTKWSIPGAFVGAVEGERIKEAVAAGHGETTLAVDGSFAPATTRTLLATLPAANRKAPKLLIESHTDGMNAVWDNGPIAIIAMARYLSRLPKVCRARTFQFAFTTAHLYGGIGAIDLAERLDREYDDGGVAGVLTLEHLGAREYATVPRSDGPGNVLQRTDVHEPTIVAATQSDALRSVVADEVTEHELDRTAIVVGTDLPNAARVPPNCSFGGEGTPYEQHLVPTVGVISAPRELFTPGFGLEAIDFAFMRAQTLTFTDLLLDMSRMSRAEIAGDLLAMRDQRAAGAPGCTPARARISFHCGLHLKERAVARLERIRR